MRLRGGPPSSSGWHTHEGLEVSLVTRGNVVLQTSTNCAGTTYGTGQVVVIPAGVPHRVANTSTRDAEALVTYTLPAGIPARNDAPNACAAW
ncbi:cupin domain-containing protein [Aldersonia sp. NBC_00410]|uniref:cupin domain-containing protein n=1 Tax=Aldersonia sp. NBC_00410 TaxID=2975954 RepID=UPI002253AA40|nr:cupin domain-containing protein [Aldersonia sp. NBC_00410]MCX5045491.1 cupin domain-containing protein [Aldersonia sp. NBC_00410]